jgi:magnesium and cobalt exporter, CNNM family
VWSGGLRMMTVSLIGTIAFLVLLGAHALLAAAGSALRNSHPSRLRQWQAEDVPGAEYAARVASHATRLIVTLRISQGLLQVLAVGVALISYTAALDSMGLSSLASTAAVLVVAWGLAGIVGYLAENMALRSPLNWAVRLARLVGIVETLVSPLAWLVLRLGRSIANAPTGRTYPLVTEEEIMTLLNAGEEGGVIKAEERSMIYSILQLRDTLAREVMVPRIDLLAFDHNTALAEATDTLLKTGYSRAPVFKESIDDIIGLVYVKDLLAAWREGIGQRTVADLAREAYFVPEAKRAGELLAEMQSNRIQMAVVVDEYGGTAGLVTFEDIVEEIVGEVRDEYDAAEELPFHRVQEGEFIFSGGIDLDDVNELAGSQLPKDTSETLGGFIYAHLGRVPQPGERIEAGGLELIVQQVVGRRIRKVQAHVLAQVDAQRGESSDGDHRTTTD